MLLPESKMGSGVKGKMRENGGTEWFGRRKNWEV
jgi:hypothetical protein